LKSNNFIPLVFLAISVAAGPTLETVNHPASIVVVLD